MLWIDDTVLDGGVCPCCNGLHPEDDLTLSGMVIRCVDITTARIAGVSRKEEWAPREMVPWIDHELAAAIALAEEALSLVPGLEDILLPVLANARSADEVYEAIYAADRYWRANSFAAGTAQAWSEAMTLSVATGVHQASDAAKVDGLFRRRMVDGMVRAGKYYTNEFFNRRVMPSLVTAVENTVAGNDAMGVAGFKTVRATLDSRLKSVPYWRLVANAASSRSYHYGLLRGGWEIGRTRYRFQAMMDERTTMLCTRMNNMEWTVSDGISLMERVAAAEDPEEVKSITPWVKPADVEGYSSRQLMDMGVAVPPLHGLCRSWLVLV